MGTTPGGISFDELVRGAESATETYGQDKWSAKRVFKVAWDSRLAFVREMLGGVTAGGIYTPPLTYPDISQLIAVRCVSKGMGTPGDSGTQARYTHAEISVDYETPKYSEEDPDTGNITEELSLTAEVLTLPLGAFHWQVGEGIYDEDGSSLGTISATIANHSLAEQPGKVMPTAEYTVSLKFVQNPNFSDLQSLVGKINSVQFAPTGVNGFIFAARRLLFTGVETSRTVQFDPVAGASTKGFALSYKFAYRRVPWDLVFKPKFDATVDSGDKAGWTKPLDGESNPIFYQGNFNVLV